MQYRLCNEHFDAKQNRFFNIIRLTGSPFSPSLYRTIQIRHSYLVRFLTTLAYSRIDFAFAFCLLRIHTAGISCRAAVFCCCWLARNTHRVISCVSCARDTCRHVAAATDSIMCKLHVTAQPVRSESFRIIAHCTRVHTSNHHLHLHHRASSSPSRPSRRQHRVLCVCVCVSMQMRVIYAHIFVQTSACQSAR